MKTPTRIRRKQRRAAKHRRIAELARRLARLPRGERVRVLAAIDALIAKATGCSSG